MPDKGRLLVFGLMMFMTTGHVLMKVLACSVMIHLNILWLALYLICDMSSFFLYKICRGDLRYNVRAKGISSWVLTVLCRIVVKTITDFTLVVQFRHRKYFGTLYVFFLSVDCS